MTVGIWGAGVEGTSAARAASHDNCDVLIVDEVLRPRPNNLPPSVPSFAGPDSLERLLLCTVVLVSPGVPRVHPFRDRLETAGIRVSSVTQEWMRRFGASTIGVTGTKGKSTTATLLASLLESAGETVQLGGNIGTPLSDLPGGVQATVAELSSYQCASLVTAPRIGVITNLFEDHLTWHGSREEYWRDKARIFGPGCETLVCDDATLRVLGSLGVEFPPEVASPSAEVEGRVPLDGLPRSLRLGQNLQNFQLAVIGAEAFLKRQLSRDEITSAGNAFAPLPHRLEVVARRNGVDWVDDTLSTVAESVIAASSAYPGELVLIVGGAERGTDYSALDAHLRAREPHAQIVTIPDNGPRIAEAYSESHPSRVHEATGLEDAVHIAASLANPGTVVILSPGAASYNAYRNFQHKSEAYIAAIHALTGSNRPM